MFSFSYAGSLEGHSDWVTSLATRTVEDCDVVLSGSRDKTLVKWKISSDGSDSLGYPEKRLRGHGGFVQDVALSRDSQWGLSASWDCSLRLWKLKEGVVDRPFVDHSKDVLSVALSHDDRLVASGSRDNSVVVWNVVGEACYKYNQTNKGHSDWVSCVRFAPAQHLVVSCGWDKLVKVWDVNQNCLRADFKGHTGVLNSLCISPDGSLCASAGRDGKAMLWNLSKFDFLSTIDCGSEINALCFSPNRYWLCSATAEGIRIYDLEARKSLDVLKPEFQVDEATNKNRLSRRVPLQCTSLAWSEDGMTLYAGFTDNKIHVWVLEGDTLAKQAVQADTEVVST